MINLSGRVFSIISVVIFVLTCHSCQMPKGDATTQSQVDTEHSAQNSLDWSGKYSGELPCESCDHIATELTLTDSQTYFLVIAKVSGQNMAIDTLDGKFEWKGNNILLLGLKDPSAPANFKVEENRLRQLNMDGQRIEGKHTDQYLLLKEGNLAVEDKRWRLVELNGKPIDGAADRHYLIFHSQSGRIEAKADCNALGFGYKIKNNDQVYLQQGFSTLMACPDDTEQNFVAALNSVDQLATDGQSLSLQKSGNPSSLRFALVQE